MTKDQRLEVGELVTFHLSWERSKTYMDTEWKKYADRAPRLCASNLSPSFLSCSPNSRISWLVPSRFIFIREASWKCLKRIIIRSRMLLVEAFRKITSQSTIVISSLKKFSVWSFISRQQAMQAFRTLFGSEKDDKKYFTATLWKMRKIALTDIFKRNWKHAHGAPIRQHLFAEDCCVLRLYI